MSLRLSKRTSTGARSVATAGELLVGARVRSWSDASSYAKRGSVAGTNPCVSRKIVLWSLPYRAVSPRQHRPGATFRPNPAEQQQRGFAAAELKLTASRSLAVLAEADTLGMADVVFLANVPKSTLSRLWHDQRWLDAVSGATLQRLISAMPGLAAYVEFRSHRTVGVGAAPVRAIRARGST